MNRYTRLGETIDTKRCYHCKEWINGKPIVGLDTTGRRYCSDDCFHGRKLLGPAPMAYNETDRYNTFKKKTTNTVKEKKFMFSDILNPNKFKNIYGEYVDPSRCHTCKKTLRKSSNGFVGMLSFNDASQRNFCSLKCSNLLEKVK